MQPVEYPKMLSADKTIFTIRFNWGYILAFVFVWSYGYYNSPLPGKNSFNTLVLAGILFLILTYAQKFRHLCSDALVFHVRDALMLLLLCAVVGFFSHRELGNALVGDDLYHAKASQLHAIAIVDFLIVHFPVLGQLPHKNLLQYTNVSILLICTLSVFFLYKMKASYRIPVIIALFFVLRVSFAKMAFFNHDSHPPFRLFPLWLTSTLLSLSDFSFRLAQTFGILLLGLFTFRRLYAGSGLLVSALIGISIITIPVYWHVAEIVEQSVWTSTIWTILALILAQHPAKSIHWVRFTSLISVFCLMRSSAFAAIPAFGLFLFISRPWRGVRKSLKDIALRIAPFLIFIPFTLKSIIEGTPAIDKTLKIGETLRLSLQDGQSLRYTLFSVTQPWLSMPFFLFLLLKQNFLRFVLLSIFFVCGYVIFYTIRPDLWGMGRYQAEYVIPFCVAGYLTLHAHISAHAFGRLVFTAAAFLALCVNIYLFMHLPLLSKPRDQWTSYFSEIKTGGVRIMSDGEGVFNFREALRAIHESGFAGATFTCGITYGSFGETLTGYSANEVKRTDQVYEKLNIWTGYSTEKINSNLQIKAALFVECGDSEVEIRKLEALGWRRWKEFRNERYGSVIKSVIRT